MIFNEVLPFSPNMLVQQYVGYNLNKQLHEFFKKDTYFMIRACWNDIRPSNIKLCQVFVHFLHLFVGRE